jgi:hypothetical protein
MLVSQSKTNLYFTISDLVGNGTDGHETGRAESVDDLDGNIIWEASCESCCSCRVGRVCGEDCSYAAVGMQCNVMCGGTKLAVGPEFAGRLGEDEEQLGEMRRQFQISTRGCSIRTYLQ